MNIKENYFQKYMEIYLNGKHMKLNKCITDVSNDKLHSELKVWYNWNKGIQQLQNYNLQLQREELHLYLFGVVPNKKTNIIKKIISLNIKPFEMILKDNGFDIIDLTTNQKIQTILNNNTANNQYICPRCGYGTDLVANFKKHLKCENICSPYVNDIDLNNLKEQYCNIIKTVTHTCEDCHKLFYSRSNFYEHKKNCYKINKLDYKINEQKKHIIENDKIIKKLQKQLTELSCNKPVSIIIITDFEKENILNIINDIDFMIKCIEDELNGFSRYLIRKHFIENHNIKKKKIKDKFIEIYEESEWNIYLLKDGLQKIFNNTEKDFKLFLNSNHNIVKKNILNKFMRNVGVPLNWSLDHNDYEFDDDMNIKTKETMKKDIYLLICEHIYRKSKETH